MTYLIIANNAQKKDIKHCIYLPVMIEYLLTDVQTFFLVVFKFIVSL